MLDEALEDTAKLASGIFAISLSPLSSASLVSFKRWPTRIALELKLLKVLISAINMPVAFEMLKIESPSFTVYVEKLVRLGLAVAKSAVSFGAASGVSVVAATTGLLAVGAVTKAVAGAAITAVLGALFEASSGRTGGAWRILAAILADSRPSGTCRVAASASLPRRSFSPGLAKRNAWPLMP